MNKENFIKELSKLNIELTEEQLLSLEKYYQILIEENKKYNLTSIVEKEQVYLKHFYDSLTIVNSISLDNQSLCDIGTGAGFPGLVLKIVYPDLKVTLVDSTLKKCKFLEYVIKELNLEKINVINERAEDYSRNTREYYDIVTSRAVAPLKHLLEYSIPLLKINGTYIAMKSNIEEELKNIDDYLKKLNIKLISIKEFELPIENSKRTIITFTKLGKTNMLYPRKYSDIKKRQI